MRLTFLAFAAVLLAAPSATFATPADTAAALAARGRSPEALALDAGRKPAEVLAFLGLERGDHALDLWTASGYYAEIMANAVGADGSVTGWEPSNFADAKSKARWEAIRARTPNARFIDGPADSFTLDPAAYDFVLMHLVYHDFYWNGAEYKFPRTDPQAVLSTIFQAVKPGGIVGVIEHVAEPGGDTRGVVDKLHRIDPAVVRADFERAGFIFDGESPVLRNLADDHGTIVFDPAVRGKTDRIVYRFKKPA